MRVVVTGSREWSDDWLFDTIIDGLRARLEDQNDFANAFASGQLLTDTWRAALAAAAEEPNA